MHVWVCVDQNDCLSFLIKLVYWEAILTCARIVSSATLQLWHIRHVEIYPALTYSSLCSICPPHHTQRAPPSTSGCIRVVSSTLPHLTLTFTTTFSCCLFVCFLDPQCLKWSAHMSVTSVMNCSLISSQCSLFISWHHSVMTLWAHALPLMLLESD